MKLMASFSLGTAALVLLAGTVASAQCDTYDQGFEVDTAGWNIFGPGFTIVRVASGTNGVTSADGSWHAEGQAGQLPAGNWGGYGAVCGCASTSCAVGTVFPNGGYRTSIDIYLDVGGGWPDDSRFDFSSAISKPDGTHRRDFMFNGAFLDSTDLTPPMAGVNRFVLAASNNSPGFPQGGVSPVAITTTGWYTLEHRFYDSGGGVLACDFTVYDSAGGVVAQWTRSDPSDIIGSTVGGNRYAWLVTNEFPYLALDNASRASANGSLILSAGTGCPPDASAAPGYQIAVTLDMTLDGEAMGFAAFVEYDMATLSYRDDLSSYTATPFPSHITSIVQADDGRLELDGNSGFANPGTTADALLATLIFDVLDECGTDVPANFEVGGDFPSELSDLGLPLPTALLDADPVTLDGTDPVLFGCPVDFSQPSDPGCSGAIVTYTAPTATDNCDLSPSVVCSPPSGSLFPVGVTTVTCTATDDCGNESECEFDVTVTGTNVICVDVELVGVTMPVTRCIHFQTDACASSTDESLSFIDHDFNGATPVRASAVIEVPCGTFTSVCAKDQQHTKWDSTGLVLSFDSTKWVGTSVISLDGGDTDDDGDVDINDVTWFLAQFGGLAANGGCPYDETTRDADFSNNGAVASEDYAFLVANWLTSSGCACAVTWVPGPGLPIAGIEARTPLQKAADLTGDGRVDDQDVELFEIRNGLSGELSAAMRASGR